MIALVLVVVLGVVLLACRVVVDRVRLAPPVLQLTCGVAIGFVPALRAVRLPPEAVLLLFLPALLYWESLRTGLRTVRANLQAILLLATVLVVVTAAAVAVAVHGLGLPWGPAWVLGAALAPTDATAVGILTGSLPKRMVTTLRAESLINDGTALVVYGVAVGATVGGTHVDALHVAKLVAMSYAGGIAGGLVVGHLSNQARRRLDDAIAANINSLLAPFAAYLLAEVLHASGVLAAVTCGLVALRKAPRFARPDGRHQRDAFWSLATYVLSGALFVLVGLQAQTAARALSAAALARGSVLALAVTAIVVGVRFGWLFTMPYLIGVLDRRPDPHWRRLGTRARFVYAVAGFRGAVSLAAVLAVPDTTASGRPFPDRDLIVFVTAGVVILTLLQALITPAVVRWAGLPPDHSDRRERALAQITMKREAMDALDDLAAGLGTAPDVVDRLRRRYSNEVRLVTGPNGDSAVVQQEQYAALARAALARELDVLLRLRDERRVDDDVVVDIQGQLDAEELRYRR